MSQLVILRHGQSVWNLENRFTGWEDVELTQKGREESRAAGKKLNAIRFDEGYASDLKRTQDCLKLILEEINQADIPITFARALNERNYGDLQGLNKVETERKFGKELVHKWRRSYNVAPPNGESLKDASSRVISYFEKVILPKLKLDKNILIVTHGNAMRALIMYLEKLTPDEIEQVNINTGEIRLYEFGNDFKIVNKTTL
mgnify:CR=1 FL=1